MYILRVWKKTTIRSAPAIIVGESDWLITIDGVGSSILKLHHVTSRACCNIHVVRQFSKLWNSLVKTGRQLWWLCGRNTILLESIGSCMWTEKRDTKSLLGILHLRQSKVLRGFVFILSIRLLLFVMSTNL